MFHNSLLHVVAKSLAGVSALAIASGAAAQDRQAVDAPQVSEAEVPGGDIVVTARKRAENLRDVPVAITALSGETLAQKNITQFIDLPRVAPNFTVSYGATHPFMFIRGFGSGALASFEQSVGKFVDNVSFGRDQDARIPIFDIERVEVLKGPQVLTFGNSATVGALNITTRKPGDTFQANGSIGYEFVGQELQAQAGITIPLMEGASFRLAGMFQELSKGRYYNPSKGKREMNIHNFAVRPSLRLQPVDGLEIVLRAEVDGIKDDGSGVVPIGQPLVANRLPFPVVGDRDHRYANYNVDPYYTDEFAQYEGEVYQADVNYDLLGGTLSSTSAWRGFDSAIAQGNDGANHAPTFIGIIWQHYKQFSQEMRFNGSYGKLDATIGGYYQRDTLLIDAAQEFTLSGFGVAGPAGQPVARMTNFDQKGRTYSAFVDLTYHLTDRLNLSGGVRFSDIRKTAGQSQFASRIIPHLAFDTSRARLNSFRDPAILPAFGAAFGTPEHAYPFGFFRLSETHWQPQAILQYEPSAKNKACLKFVRGAKVGGFDFIYTGTAASDGTFKPEYASAFEFGVKGLVLDNTLDYSIALFRTTFSDLQQSALQNNSFVISNVGKARSQGVELELNYRPSSEWRFGLNGSYLDAKFVEFKGAPCTSGQNANLAPGCSISPRAQDISGAPTQYSSKWTGTVSADYTALVGPGDHRLVIGASVFARSKFNAGAYNDPQMVQKGYALLDGHIDFGPSDGRWTASLFGRNLTDARPLDYAVLTPGNNTAVLGTYSRGRQIGLKLSFDM